MKHSFIILLALACALSSCVTAPKKPIQAKSAITYDEWNILLNEASWNIFGTSVDAAQDLQTAYYFIMLFGGMEGVHSKDTYKWRTAIYKNGIYTGSYYTTPVKEASKDAAMAFGQKGLDSSEKLIAETGKFLVEVYKYYEEDKSDLEFKEWLESVLNWKKYPEKNYDNNLFFDTVKPWGGFWDNFEAEAGYSYAGIPFLDIGMTLHFYNVKTKPYDDSSDLYPGFLALGSLAQYVKKPNQGYFMFEPMFDTYLFTNRVNKGIYLRTSIAPAFLFYENGEPDTLMDFRQDLGYKLELKIGKNPPREKMYFSIELGYGMFNFVGDTIYFDYGVKWGGTF